MDFLHAENLCGQTLLLLVSRGSSILAELQRLADHVPKIFLGRAAVQDPQQLKYADVLFDFSYLKAPDRFEQRLNTSPDLLEADDELQESHLELLERFYGLFDNIVKYIGGFNQFLEHLQEGYFLQHTMEDVLLNPEGKQLMCEALYLFGVMLLMLERHIPGPARERLIVAFLRYRGESALPNLEEVTKLCTHTGYVHPDMHAAMGVSGKAAAAAAWPKDYPESYFARFAVSQEVVSMVLDRLRSDDVYNQTATFPQPDQRTVALAQQASMLYVILYFAPDVLRRNRQAMREVVDKHFSDNWVLPVYMGWLHSLDEHWAAYPAAREALGNTLNAANVREVAERSVTWVEECERALTRFLTEGVLQEQFVLDNLSPLLNCLRKCNAVTRWLILHRRAANKRAREAMAAAGLPERVPDARLVQLLLRTSQLEFRLKGLFKVLIDSKEQRWEECKKHSSDRMLELSEYFSGERALSRVAKDEDLQAWFKQLGEQISGLAYSESTQSKTGRKIQKLIEALVSVEQFDVVDTSLQVREFLADTRTFLTQMVRAVNIKDDVMGTLEAISDFAYAWETLGDYTPYLHELIRTDPRATVLLRSVFLKLASILDVPLYRIHQANSSDDASVAHFYSGELVAMLRRVLEVIPESVFRIMSEVVHLQAASMRPLPVKVEVASLKDCAQLPERFQLAEATHQIAVFTEGILAMERTLLGVIQVDPRQMLNDGVRAQLVARISQALHTSLEFRTPRKKDKVTVPLVEQRLTDLRQRLDGFRRSFEYVQDYVGIYGLKMWQEEYTRVINFNVERECNRFLKKKILDANSKYQSRAIPIPRYAPLDPKCVSFMGRLLQAVLALTDARETVYAPECVGWYEASGSELVGIRFFNTLNAAVGVQALCGLDRMLCFRIVRDLNRMRSQCQATARSHLPVLQEFERNCTPLHALPAMQQKPYTKALKKLGPQLEAMLEPLLRVGQAQLVRQQVASELFLACRMDSSLLASALDTANRAVLRDVRAHYRDPERPYPPPENPLLPELAKYVEACGMADPLSKIYVTGEALPLLPLLLALCLLHHASKLEYSADFGTVVAKRPTDNLDGAPLCVGIATVLKQFHPSCAHQFFAFVGQYVRVSVHSVYGRNTAKAVAPLPPDVHVLLLAMDLCCRFSRLDRATLTEHVPPFVFDLGVDL